MPIEPKTDPIADAVTPTDVIYTQPKPTPRRPVDIPVDLGDDDR
jgi:hypothetical protein